MGRTGAPSRTGLLAVLAMVLVLPLALIGLTTTPASAADVGVLTIRKDVTGQVGTPTYSPGQTFSYTIRIGCSNLDGAGCRNAQLTDILPDPIELDPGVADPVQVAGVTSSTIDTTGGDVAVQFTEDLGGGDVGIQGGNEATVTVYVRVPPDATASQAGPAVNTAKVTQSNGDPRSDSASVVVDVPDVLASAVTKAVDSHGANPVPAVPGQPVDWTLTARNTSNRGVDALVLQDPADGAPDSFQYLALTDITTFTPPTGADQVQVDWLDIGGTWQTGTPVAIPADPSSLLPPVPADVHGLRFTFTSTTGEVPITPLAGAATVVLATVTRDNVVTIPPNTTVNVQDRASSHVVLGATSTPPVEASATVAIRRQPPTVAISKDFGAAALDAGKSTTATLLVTNGAVPINTMVITEPDGSGDLVAQGLTFGGFVAADIEWPLGATNASIQYVYADGFSEPAKSTTTRDTLPGPTAGHRVAGFTITFTGTMAAAQYATIPFKVTADPVSGLVDITSTNTASAQVTRSDGQTSDVVQDSDDLTRRPIRVNTSVSKNIARDWMYAVPGSTTLVSVPASVDNTGLNAATVGSEYLQITDPANPAASPSDFWDHYDLTRIEPTDIPANAKLTVSYWDGSSWQNLTGPVSGPQDSFTYDVPAGLRGTIQGVRFRFEPKVAGDLLQPGFSVTPYFRVALRNTLRSDPGTSAIPATDTTIENDVESKVHNDLAVDPTVTAEAQDAIELRPVPGGGSGPSMVDKFWLLDDGTPSKDAATVVALTDEQRTARLRWSTQGIPLTSVVVTDPSTTPSNVDQSVFDAFDLARIKPITPATDPMITFDAVSKVELFSSATSSWQDVTAQACPTVASCDGNFVGYTLTTAQRTTTLGVRLTFVESPTRGSRDGDPGDPPVGSGVAASYDNERPIDLVLQLRQQLRSNPAEAVLGTDHAYTYNTGSAGVVDNTVLLQGTGASGSYQSTSNAQISILDRPVNVTTSKDFDQTQVGLPQSGTAAGLFPLVTATLTATNDSLGKARVLSLTDAVAPSTTFDTFNLYSIDSISVPSGATSSSVVLTKGLVVDPPISIAAAAALSPAALAGVTNVQVIHTGFIPHEAGTTVKLTFQLRETHRGDSSPVVAGEQVDNIVEARVESPAGQNDGNATDSITIAEPTYGVDAGKTISPSTRTETASRTGYTVTVTGRPTGTVRTKAMTLTDATPTFWNVFDLASLPRQTVPAPVTQVRLDALTGVTYELQGSTLVARCAGSADLTACWRIGSWTTVTAGATNNWQPVLPAGVTAPNVLGLRLSARRADGGNWERPANPLVSLAFRADRRLTLRYSPDGPNTPVPTTKPDNDPAPGETQLGTFTDTVDVHADGAWQDQADLWVADDAATATTKLTHLANKIKVTKAPGNGSGAPPGYAPGTQIPYVMSFTNTGSWPMTGLTIVDRIATNANGSMLVEPRDADGDPAPSYSFTLKDKNGATLSTTGFSADLNETTGVLNVTLPAGFVFQVGDVLTFTARLVYQLGLEARTPVENRVSAKSDRIFDQCQSTHNNATAPNTSNVGRCEADTVTEPTAASPIRAVKSVRGNGGGVPGASPGDPNYDDLGVIQLGFSGNAGQCTSPNAANGFYRYPCVPITRAAGAETWQLSMTNEGNIPAKVVATIDVLPRVGDTGVTIDSPRDSRWTATLLGNFASNVDDLGGGTRTFTVYYSPTVPSTQCNAADILDETRPGGLLPSDPCFADVNARTWIPVAGASSGDLATAKALKAVLAYDGNDTGVLPGQTLHLTFDTQTADYPAVAELQDRDAIAWNSFAAGARGIRAGVGVTTSVVEPRKVGVALSTGRFDLEKVVVTPPGSDFPLPDSYQFTMSCTSNGTDVPLVDTAGASVNPVTLTPGEVVHVNDGDPDNPWGEVNVPRYASCRVQEVGAQGAEVTFDPVGPSAGTSGDVTALRDYSTRNDIANPAFPDPIESAKITATNTYAPAGFSVSKLVDVGGAVDQDGNPIAYTDTYDFTASCLFNGTQVVPTADRSFTLAEGESKDFDDLPAGSTCTVTETDNGSAASTTHVVTEDGTTGSVQSGSTATFTLGADSAGLHVNAVAYTNHYTTGSLDVTKFVTGPGADPWGGNTFTVHLECTLANADPSTVYSADHVLSKADPDWTVTDLPTGASCEVTEIADGGATFSFTVPLDGTVTIGDGTTVDVSVVNVFDLGSIRVTKQLAGDVDEDPAIATGTWTVSLGCTLVIDGTPFAVPIPGGAIRELTGDGDAVTYLGLPTGATCLVEEVSSDPAAQDVTISPAGPYTVGDDENVPVDVEVTNTFEIGSVRVTKDVTGPGADLYGAGPFEVSLACTVDDGGTPTDLVIPGGADRTLSSATSLTTEYQQLPVGAECTLTETDAGGAHDTSIVVETGGGSTTTPGTSASFTIVDDTASSGDGSDPGVLLVVDNRFDTGSLRVVKRVVGPGADRYGAGPFTVELACTADVAGSTVDVDIPDGAERELSSANDYRTRYDDLPPGAECTLTETGTGQADATSITVTSGGSTDEVDGTEATVVIGNDASDPAAQAVVRNTFLVGAVRVVKTVEAQPGQVPARTRYVVELACTRTADGATTDVAVPGGASRTLSEATSLRAEWRDLPVGAVCSVTETDDGDADSTVVRPAQVRVGAGEVATISVVNRFRPTGVAPGGETDGGDPGVGDGGLPGTGSDVPPWLPWGAAVAVLLGAALVVVSRRRT